MSKYALLDCNNFFVSCERVFRPDLETKPTIVLSNNDGCIVSRSNEVKKLGVPMGYPFFKVESIISKNKVETFSSNFRLYGDLSNRVMAALQELVGQIEPYSIDEAFFNLKSEKEGHLIKNQITQWTGIPVSIGIGPTKTLSKAANEIAKKNPEFNGVLEIKNLETLKKLPIDDVWGIGRQYAKLLKQYRISTAFDLIKKPDKWIQQKLKAPGLQTVMELRGIECKSLKTKNSLRKSILSSRSFGKPVKTLTELKEAVATYTHIASQKLRSQNLVAGRISVFINTGKSHFGQKYSAYETQDLLLHTSNTPELIKTAHECLEKIYKNNINYKKAGVLLTKLIPDHRLQLSILKQPKPKESMIIMDYINEKWGKNTIIPASTGIKKIWRMKSAMRSPEYTTNWNELLTIK